MAPLASPVLVLALDADVGQIATTVGVDHVANRLPRQPARSPSTWVDRDTDGKPVTYLGQAIKDPNGAVLTEFWNRSIHHVDSLDGSAPGPGPTGDAGLVGTRPGRCSGLRRLPYVLADNGVVLAGPGRPGRTRAR